MFDKALINYDTEMTVSHSLPHTSTNEMQVL